MARLSRSSHLALASLLLSIWTHNGVSCAKVVPPALENLEVIRTVELGGSTSLVSTTLTAAALEDNVSQYKVVLSAEEEAVTSWFQARLRGSTEELPVEHIRPRVAWKEGSYTISIPKLKSGSNISLQIDTVQTHASFPWPATSPQDGRQTLRYVGNLFFASPYATKEQKLRFRGSGSRIIGHTKLDTSNISAFVTAETAGAKSGNVVHFGSFIDVPPVTNPDFPRERVQVEYDYHSPVLTIKDLKRSAEISHWGSNLNIQNDIELRNDGPKLAGQFSRFDYQQQKFVRQIPAHIVEQIKLTLPAGIHSPYFYDLNGNVSTSNFRASPVPKKSERARPSVLEFRPRFPLLGGWNYTFTIGWDAPLKDSSKYDSKTGTYIVAIPFWTPIPDSSVDFAEVSIILPEGAEDVKVEPPFSAVTIEHGKAISYLDTIGRPKITLRAKGLTDRHAGLIYVSYKVSLAAHLRKPVAVALGTFGLFVLAYIVGWDSQFLPKKPGKN